jgi:molecular chaperone GrpE (heat shock protein)
MFKRKKMNGKNIDNEEMTEEQAGHIPVNDKRRFNADGERVKDDPEEPKVPVRSAREIELENNLKTETERRQAAEAKLVGVQAKFDEARTQMERETAEMRQRMMKTLEDRSTQAQFGFLTALLPVLDNLNLAVAASEKDSSFEHLHEGVKGTARSFEQALMSVGVEPIASVGTTFDPELHEAVDMIPVEPEEDGKIAKEYSRGYKFGTRLLRPARVQVGKAMAQSVGE